MFSSLYFEGRSAEWLPEHPTQNLKYFLKTAQSEEKQHSELTFSFGMKTKGIYPFQGRFFRFCSYNKEVIFEVRNND